MTIIIIQLSMNSMHQLASRFTRIIECILAKFLLYILLYVIQILEQFATQKVMF